MCGVNLKAATPRTGEKRDSTDVKKFAWRWWIKASITGKEGWRAQLTEVKLVKLGNYEKRARRKQRGKIKEKMNVTESKEERNSRRKRLKCIRLQKISS